MKIVEEPKKWVLKRKCWGINGDGCHALLEIDGDDIKVSPRIDPLSKECQYEFYFECPCCFALNNIDKKDIPEYMQRKAVREYDTKLQKIKEQEKIKRKI